MSDFRQKLRQTMRKKRVELTAIQRHNFALSIISPALDLVSAFDAQHLAFYFPFNGEISPLPLMAELSEQQKSLYLPVIHPFTSGQLLFISYHSKTKLVKNHFGILQPQLHCGEVLPLDEIDMLFVPLVACDKQRNRLGMGGGFYDRTLAQPHRFLSVGLAYPFQEVENLPVSNWDKPLDHLIIGKASI